MIVSLKEASVIDEAHMLNMVSLKGQFTYKEKILSLRKKVRKPHGLGIT